MDKCILCGGEVYESQSIWWSEIVSCHNPKPTDEVRFVTRGAHKACLQTRGYEPTLEGLNGWQRVNQAVLFSELSEKS